ncbi:MAG: extracellular solute-binding protein, partial [Anaerolineae bacterium]
SSGSTLPFTEVVTAPAIASAPARLPTRTSTVDSVEASVALEVWECLSPEPSRVLRQDAAEFQKQHPGMMLTVRHCEDAHTWSEMLITGAAVGWHVLLGDAILLATLQQQGLLLPLEDLLTRHELSTLVAPARVAAMRDSYLWGLADTLGFHLLLYYRRDLVAVPPADVAALTALARSLTEPPERWGLALNSYDPLWVIPWLGACGEWLTDARGRFTLDTPAMVRALGMYRDWHHPRKGIAPLTTHYLARQMFMEGRVAMLLDGDWALGELEQEPTLDWAAAALPMVDTPDCLATPLVAGRFWMVHRDLPLALQRAAADWLRYVFAPERQVRWALRFNTLPTRREALQDMRILSNPHLRVSAQQMQMGRALPLGVDANYVLEVMRAPLRAVLDGSMTPDEAARTMQQNATRQDDRTDVGRP